MISLGIMSAASGDTPLYDRSFLLSGPKRNEVLELWEVLRYGRDSFGDADYVCLYGMKPEEWFARGVRILGRTAVECTRDALADRLARDIADVARAAPQGGGSVWSTPSPAPATRCTGSGGAWACARPSALRSTQHVFEASRKNLASVGAQVELLHEDYEAGLRELRVPDDELLIAFLAPPWGDALSPESGLDLRRTSPPVGYVADVLATTFRRHRILMAIQIYEATDPDAIADVTSRFDWSTRHTYDIDPPGRNQSVLLGTLGWAVDGETPGRSR